MQHFSYCRESDSDSDPNCPVQNWDWTRNRDLLNHISGVTDTFRRKYIIFVNQISSTLYFKSSIHWPQKAEFKHKNSTYFL